MSSSDSAQRNWLQHQWQPPHSLRRRSLPWHHSSVHAAAALHDEVDQGGLCVVSTSVSMCLQVAPDKNSIRLRLEQLGGQQSLEMKSLVFSMTWHAMRAESCYQTQDMSLTTVLIQGQFVSLPQGRCMGYLKFCQRIMIIQNWQDKYGIYRRINIRYTGI